MGSFPAFLPLTTFAFASICVAIPAITDTPDLPASQAQYAHPEAPYTQDFEWKSVSLSGLRSPGTLRRWTQPAAEVVHLEYEHLNVKISAPVPGVLRLQVYQDTTPFEWPTNLPVGIRSADFQPQPLTVHQADDQIEVSGSELHITLSVKNFALNLTNSAGDNLLTWKDLHFESIKNGIRSYARFGLTPEDHFFGLGGKSSPLDRRGRMADTYSVKVETKRGDYGGFAIPYFLNPRGYGLILNNPAPRVFFDFGYESNEQWTLTTPEGPLDLFFLAGETPQTLSRRYHALTGVPTIPPKFMLGLWVSWFSKATADEWLEFMQRFRDEKWPADLLVLDLYWRGGMAILSEGGQGKNLDWDQELFGDGPAMIEALCELDLNVALHVNTRMFAEPVLSEGLSQGFLRESGYEQVVSVLSNDAARDWNWNLYAPRVAEGTAAWWIDNGERVDGRLAGGLASRNLYGEVWNQFVFERMQAAGLDRRLVLARGGWLGTQTNATQWPGDTGPGVERQQEDLWFIGNLAMSGIPYSGVDLGGFKADGLDRELMHSDENIIRRVAHGFLIYPIPRIHNSYRAPPKFPWRYSAKVQAVYRQYLELRYALFPYYYSAAVESSTEAIPMVRPLAFDSFQDERTYAMDDEVLVGPALLMAPVMETSAHSRYVYLPTGTWFDYWSGEKFSGDRWVLAEAPLYGERGLPIFVKHGAIIPSRPPAQFNADGPEPIIHLDLYPTESGSYRLWEDPDTFSPLSYTLTEDQLTVTLTNHTAASRLYTLACRDGHYIAGTTTTTSNPQITVQDGQAHVQVSPGTQVVVEFDLLARAQ